MIEVTPLVPGASPAMSPERKRMALLHGPDPSDGGRFQDFNIRLVELSPPRRMNASIAPADCVATLVVSR